MRVTVREVGLIVLARWGYTLLLAGLTFGAARSASADESATASATAKPARTPRAGTSAGEARSPAFETLPDGSTRLSLEISEAVQYETKVTSNRVTCVMKGIHAARRNDYNPLVTVNFNTPVANARLLPRGRDLLFVVDLRAPVKPQVKTDAAKDGGMVLEIDFPKGDYIPAPQDSPPASVAGEPVPGNKTIDKAP